MNRTVKDIGRAALVPVAIVAVRYAWKAVAPAISESMPLHDAGSMVSERLAALRERLDRSGATGAATAMLRHDKKALQHARAGEMRKWQALRARIFGSPTVNALGDKMNGVHSSVMGWQARREANAAAKHKAAALKAGAQAEKRKRRAVNAWMGETAGMLRDRMSRLRALMAPIRFQEVGKAARHAWAEYGWGEARAEREAAKRRNNVALGLAAGLGIGVGAAYLFARRRGDADNGYAAGQAQRLHANGNGSVTATARPERAVDHAMRQAEATLDHTTAVTGDLPAREIGAQAMTAASAAQDGGGEAWIVIPKEQWAEFIQRVSDGHQGWNVRVENEGNLSLDETPVDEARFSGMRLEPSLARPGVRLFVGRLPEHFFEHVIPDLRTVEHLPSDEAGYQGVRLTTTVDRVTIRFTDPGEATDELYRGD